MILLALALAPFATPPPCALPSSRRKDAQRRRWLSAAGRLATMRAPPARLLLQPRACRPRPCSIARTSRMPRPWPSPWLPVSAKPAAVLLDGELGHAAFARRHEGYPHIALPVLQCIGD